MFNAPIIFEELRIKTRDGHGQKYRYVCLFIDDVQITCGETASYTFMASDYIVWSAPGIIGKKIRLKKQTGGNIAIGELWIVYNPVGYSSVLCEEEDVKPTTLLMTTEINKVYTFATDVKLVGVLSTFGCLVKVTDEDSNIIWRMVLRSNQAAIEVRSTLSDQQTDHLLESDLTIGEWYTITVQQTVANNVYTYQIQLWHKNSGQIEEYSFVNTHPLERGSSKIYACSSAGPANAQIRNMQLSTVDPGPCPDSDFAQINRGWSLVRRTESNTFSFDDDLAGVESDGTLHNNPKGIGFTEPFQNVVPDYNQFLFATGDCSKWILTDRKWIDPFNQETSGLKSVTVESSHLTQSKHVVTMYGGVDADAKFPLITPVSYTIATSTSVESDSLYHENDEAISNDAASRGGLNVWIRKRPVSWGEWGEFALCTATCGRGTMTRSRQCFHDNYLVVDQDCQGSDTESRICNTDFCPSVPSTCNCNDKSKVRCRDNSWCHRREFCELNTWFQPDPTDNGYECRHQSYSVCKAWGDPHIVTFDNAKIDVYGVAQYVLAEHDGTANEIPAFKILMNTMKYRKVAVLEVMYFTFPMRDGTKVEIETDIYGKSNIYLNGGWMQLYSQKTADFVYKKRGRTHVISTWFGIRIFQRGYTFIVRIPTFYQDSTYGLCMNMNKDKSDDYTLKDGTVLPVPPQGGYKRTWMEYDVANSWTTGSAELRGCLQYEGQELTEEEKQYDKGPGPDEDLDCSAEEMVVIIQECDALLNSAWLEDCRDLVEVTQTFENCKVDYCMDPSVETKTDILENYIKLCAVDLPEDDPIVCDWPTLSGLADPECGTNQIFRGCVDSCRNITECGESDKQCGEIELEGLCICDTGFVMSDGECILEESCPLNGVWGDWSSWSACSQKCDSGESTRSRFCFGPGTCDGIAVESVACQTCSCSLNSRKNVVCDQYCITDSNDLKTVNIYRQYTFEFELKINGGGGTDQLSIIRIGTGGDAASSGDRHPAVFIMGDSPDKLRIHSNVNGNVDYTVVVDIVVGEWFNVTIEQFILDSVFWYQINVNDINIHLVENEQPETFENAQISAADQFYDPADACVRNVFFTSNSITWSSWTEFTDCTHTCGGGTKTRTKKCIDTFSEIEHPGLCTGTTPLNERICNTGPCPGDPLPCICDENKVRCRSTLCPNRYDCELTNWFKSDPSENKYECRHKKYSKCKAQGDPHLTTFDNAKIDVYGIAQYVMAEHNGTDDGMPYFKVLMNTQPVRHVSRIEYMYLTFPAKDGTLLEIETDAYGGAQIYMNGAWVKLNPQNTADFQVKKIRKLLRVQTWFGLTIWHKKSKYSIQAPAFYRKHTFGLCQNSNENKYDDYTSKDGEIFTYPPQRGGPLHISEYKTAISWITGSNKLKGCLQYEEDPPDDKLLISDPGPDSTVDLACHPNDQLIVTEACTNLLLDDWLKDCRDVVEVTQSYDDCNIDYCMDQTENTLQVILENYITECKPHLPVIDPIICDWPTLSGLSTPECGENQIWSGCSDHCWNVTQCYEEDACEEEFEPEALCICSEGFVMSGDACVLQADCPAGEYAEWSAWDSCSVTCGVGELVRSRFCSGPGSCDGTAIETTPCDEGTCPDKIAWTKWSEFGECTVTCGSGILSRTRQCVNDQMQLQDGTSCGDESDSNEQTNTRICNTRACATTPIGCTCDANKVRCHHENCERHHRCELTTWFNYADPDQNSYECIHKSLLDCRAWGDPHIVTFDNAKNDVYGVAQYVLSQHDGLGQLPFFKVLMNTKKLRRVSKLEYMYLTFPTRSGGLIEIETSRYKKANMYYNGEWIALIPQTNADFTFGKHGRWFKVTTWFGLEIYHHRATYVVRLPAFYRQQVSGLCMNCNQDKLDDYTKKDGTVLSFPSQHGYKRTAQEFESASSWIVGSVELRGCLPYDEDYGNLPTDDLPTADPGPDASVDLACDADEQEIVDEVCSTLLLNNWLKDCTDLLDVSMTYESCRIDYCMDPSFETQYDVLSVFIEKCASVLDKDDPILCNWATLSGLVIPICEANQEFRGCVDSCNDITECADGVKECEDIIELQSLCICKEGFVMFDGDCIEQADCATAGVWSSWSTWDECSKPCNTGDTFRSRICLGPGKSQIDKKWCFAKLMKFRSYS